MCAGLVLLERRPEPLRTAMIAQNRTDPLVLNDGFTSLKPWLAEVVMVKGHFAL